MSRYEDSIRASYEPHDPDVELPGPLDDIELGQHLLERGMQLVDLAPDEDDSWNTPAENVTVSGGRESPEVMLGNNFEDVQEEDEHFLSPGIDLDNELGVVHPRLRFGPQEPILVYSSGLVLEGGSWIQKGLPRSPRVL